MANRRRSEDNWKVLYRDKVYPSKIHLSVAASPFNICQSAKNLGCESKIATTIKIPSA
jgi:hypothetical protein